jgi:hypothetical protein
LGDNEISIKTHARTLAHTLKVTHAHTGRELSKQVHHHRIGRRPRARGDGSRVCNACGLSLGNCRASHAVRRLNGHGRQQHWRAAQLQPSRPKLYSLHSQQHGLRCVGVFVGTYLPLGIYGARLLFFVSARTNKRYHHHVNVCVCVFTQHMITTHTHTHTHSHDDDVFYLYTHTHTQSRYPPPRSSTLAQL